MGGAVKRTIASFTVAVAAIVFALVPLPVKADPATPIDFSLNNVEVFRSIWETDDWLLLFQYTINLYPLEYVPVTQLFDFRLYDAATTTALAAANVYAYSNLGYGLGIGSVYFPALTAPADTDLLYPKLPKTYLPYQKQLS